MKTRIAVLLLAWVLALSVALPAGAATPAQRDGPCAYRATFVADVTIPDDTAIEAGARFVKTWRVRNDGSCAWGSNGYAVHGLAHWGADPLGGPDLVPLPGVVLPGETVDLSVNMAAPALAGVYLSEWMLKVDTDLAPELGEYLGVGPSGQQPLFVRIIVRQPVPSYQSTRISFARGATSAAMEGNLGNAPARDYLLRALKGQTMIVSLFSPSANTRLEVLLRGQRDPLPAQASGDEYWRGVLPTTGDYILRVSSRTRNARYSLFVEIPRRISFARGAISGSVDGATSDRRTVAYLVRAMGGQQMTVELTAPRDTAGLTIYGLEDGQPLVRAVSGATSWTGELPATQDYVIEVSPAVDSAVRFTVDVTIQ